MNTPSNAKYSFLQIVPRDYVIHRHCFTGNWKEAEKWLSTFCNLYLGITALVTYPYTERGCNVQDVVSQMPLNRLLLETDAPYFRPHCVSLTFLFRL